MGHSLIIGQTESGKSTLAKVLAGHTLGLGVKVLVYDPLGDTWPDGALVLQDEEQFLEAFWGLTSAVVFIDESGATVGRYNDRMTATATRGRHQGHAVTYICQRVTQIDPIIRHQCNSLSLFSAGASDGEILAAEFNEPELEQCVSLKPGEFFHKKRHGKLSSRVIFTRKDEPATEPTTEPTEEENEA